MVRDWRWGRFGARSMDAGAIRIAIEPRPDQAVFLQAVDVSEQFLFIGHAGEVPAEHLVCK